MIEIKKMDLQLFADGGGDAGAGGDAGSTAEVHIGDTLEDGTIVDARLASSMKENADRYPTRKTAAQAQGQPADGQGGQQAQGAQQGEETEEQQWAEAKKKFAKFYGNDVQAAVKDRFKNQADANEKLNALEPMLRALMKREGVDTLDALNDRVLNDDSLWEEEAEEAGMTVEAYKNFQQLKAENDAIRAQQQKSMEDRFMEEHFQKLAGQAEQLKQRFPDFDLAKELRENERFRDLVSPNIGCSVEEAFFMLHKDELMPQLMAYGVQVGKDQVSRSIQANAKRPTEGASMHGSAGVDVHIDPKGLTDDQYDEIVKRARRGEHVVL